MANRGARWGGGVLSWRRWILAWLLYVLHCLINKNAKAFVFRAQSRLMNIFYFFFFNTDARGRQLKKEVECLHLLTAINKTR